MKSFVVLSLLLFTACSGCSIKKPADPTRPQLVVTNPRVVHTGRPFKILLDFWGNWPEAENMVEMELEMAGSKRSFIDLGVTRHHEFTISIADTYYTQRIQRFQADYFDAGKAEGWDGLVGIIIRVLNRHGTVLEKQVQFVLSCNRCRV